MNFSGLELYCFLLESVNAGEKGVDNLVGQPPLFTTERTVPFGDDKSTEIYPVFCSVNSVF